MPQWRYILWKIWVVWPEDELHLRRLFRPVSRTARNTASTTLNGIIIISVINRKPSDRQIDKQTIILSTNAIKHVRHGSFRERQTDKQADRQSPGAPMRWSLSDMEAWELRVIQTNWQTDNHLEHRWDEACQTWKQETQLRLRLQSIRRRSVCHRCSPLLTMNKLEGEEEGEKKMKKKNKKKKKEKLAMRKKNKKKKDMKKPEEEEE